MLIRRSASNTRFCTYFTFSRAWNKFHESPRLESVSLTRALRFHVFPHQESPFPILEFAFTFSVVSLRVNSSAFGNTSTFSRARVRLSVDEVRDPVNGQVIQQAIPSGVQALLAALRAAFGEADQLRATRAMEVFFEC